MANVESRVFNSFGPMLGHEFMEQAGRGIAEYILNVLFPTCCGSALIMAGKGNNGGDAFVAGRYLLSAGWQVTSIILESTSLMSALCVENKKYFLSSGGRIIDSSELLQINWENYTFILDGLFGTGFYGKLSENYLQLIEKANSSKVPILAIDIPSGLDGNSGQGKDQAIHADLTFALEMPKTGYFLQKAWENCGTIAIISFGLSNYLPEKLDYWAYYIDKKWVTKHLPRRSRCAHKYEIGGVYVIAGGLGMGGASILVTKAALRAGAGMVWLSSKKAMLSELSQKPIEVVALSVSDDLSSHEYIDQILQQSQKARSIVIGPGLGRNSESFELVKGLAARIEKSTLIMDADALFLFGDCAFALPKKVIMTPHLGELARLLKKPHLEHVDCELIELCKNFAKHWKTVLVVKGAPTFIVSESGDVFVCDRGDPGMAKAGSGDVLSGIIAAMAAQGLDTLEAAIVGVYVHGLAGEIGAAKRSSFSLLASELCDDLGEAFLDLLAK